MIVFISWACGFAHADDEDTSGQQEQSTHQASKRTAKKKAKSKGTPAREKETEGTEAPDRFEADTVIKSQYKLDGKQLEVDPD